MKWNETWLVDEYDNKISLESSTSPIITYDSVSTWTIVGYTYWTTSYTVTSDTIRHVGKVDSNYGGSMSFDHRLSAVQVQIQ